MLVCFVKILGNTSVLPAFLPCIHTTFSLFKFYDLKGEDLEGILVAAEAVRLTPYNDNKSKSTPNPPF